MSYLRISRLLLICLFVSKFLCEASELPATHEPMGLPNAPLGAVWVQDLEQSVKQYHLKMAKIELDATSTVGIGVQTNIALFGLSIRMKSGDVVPILDQTSRIFVSGGNMLVNPRNGDTEDISSKRKRYRDDLTAQEEKLKKSKQEIIRFTGKVLEDTGNPEQSSQDFLERLKFVQKNEHAVTQAKTSIETLEAEAET
jgi:hypothetical protein